MKDILEKYEKIEIIGTGAFADVNKEKIQKQMNMLQLKKLKK